MIKKIVGKILPQKLKSRLKDAADVVRYTAPDPRRPSVPLSPRAQGWLETLRRDGIVRIESPALRELAAHVEKTYCRVVEANGYPPRVDGALLGGKELFAQRKHQPDMDGLADAGLGREEQYLLSFRDPLVAGPFLDPDLAGLCYNYLRRQPYYRNQPVVDIVVLDPKADPPEDVSPIHVDHLRQMSGMLLVSELTESTTHMEYYMGSHKRSLLKEGVYKTRQECKDWAAAHPKALRPLIGPPGTLYVFDATAIHRRLLVSGSTRKMFHWNITSGHHLQPFAESLEGWKLLEDAPDYVAAAFGGARAASAERRY